MRDVSTVSGESDDWRRGASWDGPATAAPVPSATPPPVTGDVLEAGRRREPSRGLRVAAVLAACAAVAAVVVPRVLTSPTPTPAPPVATSTPTPAETPTPPDTSVPTAARIPARAVTAPPLPPLSTIRTAVVRVAGTVIAERGIGGDPADLGADTYLGSTENVQPALWELGAGAGQVFLLDPVKQRLDVFDARGQARPAVALPPGTPTEFAVEAGMPLVVMDARQVYRYDGQGWTEVTSSSRATPGYALAVGDSGVDSEVRLLGPYYTTTERFTLDVPGGTGNGIAAVEDVLARDGRRLWVQIAVPSVDGSQARHYLTRVDLVAHTAQAIPIDCAPDPSLVTAPVITLDVGSHTAYCLAAGRRSGDGAYVAQLTSYDVSAATGGPAAR